MIVDPNADDWFILVQRVFSGLLSTLWCGYRSLTGHFGVALVVWKISVVQLTCCSSAGSFLKHPPHHAHYSRFFQSIRRLSYVNYPLYLDGKWQSCAAEATGKN